MAIIHMDNFDTYGGNNAFSLNGIYSQYNGTGLQLDPSGTGNYVGWLPPVFGGGGNYANIRMVLPSTNAVTGAACRFYLDALSPGGSIKPAPIRFLNGDGSPAITCVVEPTGQISVRAGGFGSSVLFASATPVVTAGAWYHIELKINGSIGLELRVEGVTVGSYTFPTLNPVYANLPIFEFANSPDVTSAGVTMLVKDFVLWNGAGTSNVDFVGTVQVKHIVPDGDTSLNWSPSTGTNGWSILDNNPPVDSVFIQANTTPPAPYVGTLTNLPIDAVSVKAVMTRVRASKQDGGDGFLQSGVVSGASIAVGANRPITASPAYWQDVFEIDPATSAPWLPTSVNNLKIQINRTA